MTYLTYDEYKTIGGTLDETAFNRNIDRVNGVVTNATHNRVEAMHGVPKEVKSVCRELVEYYAEHFGSSRQISSRSQSAGGVSESESYVMRSAEEHTIEINNILFDYLGNVTNKNGTPLLYRGCSI